MILNTVVTGSENAPALVLGSSLGQDAHMWDEVLPYLDDFRVIRYEFFGHGKSDVLPQKMARTADLGNSIIETLDQLGINKFHIAGLSLGAMMALWVSINYPQRVRSLTMMCAGSAIRPSAPWHEKAAQVRAGGTAPLVQGTMERWFTPEFIGQNSPAYQRTVAAFENTNALGYAQCCEVIADLDCRPHLQDLQVPAAIVHAEYDGTLPPAAAAELATQLHARTYFVPGAAHLAAVEQPQAVGEALANFLGEGEK
ncbi:MAG: alpha/beta fold hydrolase [Actinomycetaceae bacterium]|nr:alpha/beta fold hydrolase [Actinomycetaceae bacterium]